MIDFLFSLNALGWAVLILFAVWVAVFIVVPLVRWWLRRGA